MNNKTRKPSFHVPLEGNQSKLFVLGQSKEELKTYEKGPKKVLLDPQKYLHIKFFLMLL